MKIREKLAEISKAASDTAATHALIMWLDTLPPEILIAAEGRRRANMSGMITGMLPRYRSPSDDGSSVEAQIESDSRLARMYFEHPNMIWSGEGWCNEE